MSFSATLGTLLCVLLLLRAWAATHDELPQCGLTGVYKTRQSVLESPNYPDNYPVNTCWDYVVRSPYRCPTKFHIQFLDFYLESSLNCSNDYLAIGLENDGDDMDVLCGQVIGIRKYHTPDGILRLRFLSDESPWTTGKGFKLLITRLACEREDLLQDNLQATAEQTELQAPAAQLQPPSESAAGLFRNFSSAQQQHQILALPAVFVNQGRHQLSAAADGQHYYQPTQPAIQVPPHPLAAPATAQPCASPVSLFYLPTQSYQSQQQLPLLTEQYPTNSWQSAPAYHSDDQAQPAQQQQFPAQHACCAAGFQQQRFYLSSPGFPQTAFTSLLPTQQRDCQFQLAKFAPSVCRLHVAFKFFDFGHAYTDNGATRGIFSSKDVCTEDFVEIDGERFCGCRSGYVHTSFWRNEAKVIRMRMGYSGLPSTGFLLDILQEQCFPIEQQSNGYNNFGALPGKGPYDGLFATNFGQSGPANVVPLQQPTFVQPQAHAELQYQLQSQLQPPAQSQQQPQQIPPQQPTPQQQAPPLQQPLPSFQHQQQPLYLPQSLYRPQSPYQPTQFNTFPSQFDRYNSNAPFWSSTPQFRQTRSLNYAKSDNVQQPLSVVETNSTRKEFYFYDGDEAFARARPKDEPDDPARVFSVDQQRCSFDTGDALRLAADVLWITKPICQAPRRSLFT